MTELKLTCRDCSGEFSFSEAEQEYFRAQGFAPPKRCLQCRANNRRAGPRGKAPSRTADAAEHANGAASETARTAEVAAPRRIAVRRAAGPPPDRGAARATDGADAAPPVHENGAAPRPMFAATCSLCASETQVPFQPDGVRPAFCLPCLKRRTR